MILLPEVAVYEVEQRSARNQRRAVGTYFGLVGVAVGVWVARIPEIQARLKLDDGRLGLVLLMTAIGALVAMPLTGILARRFGTQMLAWGSAALVCVLLPLIPWAPTVPALMAVFAAYGAVTGIYGVVVNAMAVELETAQARPILSTFHGLFSLGGLVGAMIAAGCLAWPLGPITSLGLASAGIGVTYLVAGPWLPAAVIRGRDQPREEGEGARARWSWPPRRLILLGGFAFCGLVGEGSMGDWSAVYLRRTLGASATVASLGYAAYSLGMTTGRFAGDTLSSRVGDVLLLRLGACLAAVGLGGAVATGHPLAAILGFTLVGGGLANAVPILYRAAARTPGIEPVAGIATTSTVGYFGFLAGPPVIGLIASRTTLGVALGCVAVAIGLIAVSGRLVQPPTMADPETQGLRPVEVLAGERDA